MYNAVVNVIYIVVAFVWAVISDRKEVDNTQTR